MNRLPRKTPLRRKAPLRSGSGLRRTSGRRVVPLAAGKPLRRTGRVNPVNRKRREAEFARCYGGEERVAFVRSLPSVATGRRPCVNAHLGTGGTGRKADARHIIPLTWEEHEEMHRIGERAFAARYSLDLYAAAEETHARWLAHLANA